MHDCLHELLGQTSCVILIIVIFHLILIKKRLLPRCINRFKSDLINNMDHMRISGNEPSSVILSQTKCIQKLKMTARKCQNKLKSKGMVL